jgi:hypothetical protein
MVLGGNAGQVPDATLLLIEFDTAEATFGDANDAPKGDEAQPLAASKPAYVHFD